MTTTGPVHWPNQHDDHTATAVIAGVCGLGFAGAVSPAVEHAVTAALLTLAALGAVVLALRWIARVRRERREDRADLLAAIAWRAAHLPADHLARPPPAV